MTKVLVTGANGFIGRAVCKQIEASYNVRCGLRSAKSLVQIGAGMESTVVGEIGPDTRWENALKGIDAVVHLAAKVHVVQQSNAAIMNEYHRLNVQGTDALARAAVRAGVRRFVYLSSVKVNGDATPGDRGFVEADCPAPQDLYGKSKWEAEQVLAAVSRETGMEIVILRPPLVYGAGVKANFLSLLRAVDRGFPLPLGKINNRRSFIFVENLADAIARCLQHPDAAGRTFLVADGTISTPDLVRKVALGLGRRACLLPVPVVMLQGIGALLGKSSSVDKLTSSLVVDDREIRRMLGWVPPVSMDDGVTATCNWYKLACGNDGLLRQ